MFKRTSVLLCAFALSVSTMAFAQSDAALTASVKSKLAADETVKASRVNVTTDAHVVTLSGSVDSPAAKDRALAIARDTTGVTSVVDKLTVKNSVADKAADGVAKGADKSAGAVGTAAHKTADATEKSKDAVGDAAEKTGKAVNKAAKETGKAVDKAASKTADAVSGGADKSADATKHAGEKTSAALTDAEITTSVKAKLLGDGTTPGLKVDVDTKDGVVTLHGDVPTAAARTQAASLARDTKGVKSVINKLTVPGK